MFIATQQRTQSTAKPSRHKSTKGFTLIELLFVVAIIGAIAAIAIPMYRNYVDKAQVAVAISTLDSIRKNCELFHIDYQDYPTEPIDFSTGKDGAAQTIFSSMLLDQINDDLTVPLYNTTANGYILTAKARDSKQTVLTLTPSEILKAP